MLTAVFCLFLCDVTVIWVPLLRDAVFLSAEWTGDVGCIRGKDILQPLLLSIESSVVSFGEENVLEAFPAIGIALEGKNLFLTINSRKSVNESPLFQTTPLLLKYGIGVIDEHVYDALISGQV